MKNRQRGVRGVLSQKIVLIAFDFESHRRRYLTYVVHECCHDFHRLRETDLSCAGVTD